MIAAKAPLLSEENSVACAGYRADDGAVDELVGQAQKLHPQLSTFECHLDDSTLSVGFDKYVPVAEAQ